MDQYKLKKLDVRRSASCRYVKDIHPAAVGLGGLILPGNFTIKNQKNNGEHPAAKCLRTRLSTSAAASGINQPLNQF